MSSDAFELGVRQNEKLVLLACPVENTKPVNYQRDCLLTYIDHLKYRDFINDSDGHFEKDKIINFDTIHKQCCGEKVYESEFREYRTIVLGDFVK